MTQAPVLVVVDQVDGAPSLPTTELLTVARAVAGPAPVEAVWLGPDLPGDGARARLGQFGATRIHAPQLDGLAPQLAAVAVEAVHAVVTQTQPQAVLVVSSFAGKELAAGLAVALGSGAVVDASGVHRRDDGVLVADKTVFGATWDTRCAVTGGVPVIAVEPTAITAEPVPEPVVPDVGTLPVAFSDRARAVRVLERTEHPRSGRVPLTEAATVVVGGRGTEGDFSLVEELAAVLGGAVGATRDVTDEGWREHSAQVGQTGVTIAPRLYIGAGVSGAVHHTVGMQAAQTVVAINTDPEAPIFEIADFGVVGALEDVLPQAIAALRHHLAT